jgi:hypothetical protein
MVAVLGGAPVAAYFSRSTVQKCVKYAAKSGSNRRGRPRKFAGPSRAVTLTLPHDTIAALHSIDTDLSRAVVAAVQSLEPTAMPRQVQLASFGTTAVIVVPDSRTLRDRTGVELVPIADGRALMAFDDRATIPQVELRVMDALREGTLKDGDRVLFEQLAEVLRNTRRATGVDIRQRTVVVMSHNGKLDASGLPEQSAEAQNANS